MFNQMQQMLDRTTAALLSGQTEELVRRCDYPMVVHSATRILPFQTPQDYAAALAHLCNQLRGPLHVTSIVARLRSMELPLRGRFRAFVRLTYHFATGSPSHETNAVYFCRLAGDEIRVEMVEMECALLPGQPLRGRAA